MKIDVTFTADEIRLKNIKEKIGVVIDVLRATTTVVIALNNGGLSFVPLATTEEAIDFAQTLERNRFLLGGAKKGMKIPGFDLGNSPNDYAEEIVRGKHIIFTSSNGTKAMHELKGCKEVFIASFLNVSAICKRLILRDTDCLIACSGDMGLFSLGDTICAGMIVDRLSGMAAGKLGMSDSAIAAQILYGVYKSDIRKMLLQSEWGRHLIDIGMGKDIDICSKVDIAPIVPKFRDEMIFVDGQ